MLDAGRKGTGEGEEETSPKRRGNRRDTWAPGLTGALIATANSASLITVVKCMHSVIMHYWQSVSPGASN